MSETRKLRITSSAITKPRPAEAESRSTPSPQPQATAQQDGALRNGDRIEYAVTHELDVDGEKAWVKYGVNASIGANESADEATDRVVTFVNGTVIEAATRVANQILRG